MKHILLSCISVVSLIQSSAQSTTITISQVYGGGGSGTGSPAYTHDYVELHNLTAAAIDISGYSLQYGSSTGNFGSSSSNIYVFPPNTAIAAYGYFTVKLGGAGSLGATFTADQTSTNLSMAAGSGKVALVNVGTALGCGATATPCTLPNVSIIDLVSYGASNNGEGGTTVNNGAALNSSQGAIRIASGCIDTDNNNGNFMVATTANGLTPRTDVSGAVTNCSLLPVNFTSLTGKRKERTIQLVWTVNGEKNIVSYSVERSLKGSSNWVALGLVGATNITGEKSYAFTDAKPSQGINLYRLQQTETNGSRKYSIVIPVVFEGVGGLFSLVPNPAKGATTLRSFSSTPEKVQIRILDVSGRILSEQISFISAAMPAKIDLSVLRSGQYFVQMKTATATQTEKIMINE